MRFSISSFNFLTDLQKQTVNTSEFVADYISYGSWNRVKLSTVLPNDIVSQILFVPIPYFSEGDEMVWEPTSSSKFTVKTASLLLNQQVPSHSRSKQLLKMWNCNILPKLKVFV